MKCEDTAISPLATTFSKVVSCYCVKMRLQVGKKISLMQMVGIIHFIFSNKSSSSISNVWCLCYRFENIVGKENMSCFNQFTLNPFPQIINLQQTTLKTCRKIPLNERTIIEYRFEQFLLLSPCFQKGLCSRGIRKRLHEGKG